MIVSAARDEADNGFLDALPYFESTNEDYEEYALALIEDEMKLLEPRQADSVSGIRFRSPIMQQECNLLIVGSKFIERQALPGQKNQDRPQTGEAGVHGVREAKCRYEEERIRSQVLEVEKDEAVESWKKFNECLSLHQMELSGAVKKQFEAVEEINYQRQKLQQQQLGPQIDTLSMEYQRTLHRRNQLKHSIRSLPGN